MDIHTFGSSQGAINLVTTLGRAEYSNCSSKVSAILTKFYQSTAVIVFIPDITVREAVLQMWYKKFVDRVQETDIPDVIKSHTRCVLKTRYLQCK